MKLKIKVIPKASKNAIVGWLGDELKIMVTAAPEKGKANKAVVEVLARALQLPKHSVQIVAGSTSARKIIELCDISKNEFHKHKIGQ